MAKFVTVKVSENLNLIQSMSTQRNQQLGWFVFSKVIECLEQSIRKQIDCKRINIEYQIQMNWVQNIRTEMRKYKAVKCFET